MTNRKDAEARAREVLAEALVARIFPHAAAAVRHGDTDQFLLAALEAMLTYASEVQREAIERAAVWHGIESAPDDGTPFIATIVVQNIGGTKWRETHVVWVNDETGEIDNDCEQGWGLKDYDFWMPLPAAPAIGDPVEGEGR